MRDGLGALADRLATLATEARLFVAERLAGRAADSDLGLRLASWRHEAGLVEHVLDHAAGHAVPRLEVFALLFRRDY